MQTRRHHEFARPFWGRCPQQRRLNLTETLLVHRGTQRTVDHARSRRLRCMASRRMSRNGSAVGPVRPCRSGRPIGTAVARRRQDIHRALRQFHLAVAKRSLTVPSDGATVPLTRTTYSLRASTCVDDHLEDADWSRTSRNARCSPCSRRLATHPQTVTVWPISDVDTDRRAGRANSWLRNPWAWSHHFFSSLAITSRGQSGPPCAGSAPGLTFAGP